MQQGRHGGPTAWWACVLMLGAAGLGLAGCAGAPQRAMVGTDLRASPSELEFIARLDGATVVSQAEVLHGMLLARTGATGASFADDAVAAADLGWGAWNSPREAVSVRSAAELVAAAMGAAGEPDAVGLLKFNGMLPQNAAGSDWLSGPVLLAMMGTVKDMTGAGATLAREVVPPPMPAPVPVPRAPAPDVAGATPAPSAPPAKEAFEDYDSAPKAAPIAKPEAVAGAPAERKPAPPPGDVPKPRPEPLPPASPAPAAPAPPPAPPAEPVKPKNPWSPGTPVPQKPDGSKG